MERSSLLNNPRQASPQRCTLPVPCVLAFIKVPHISLHTQQSALVLSCMCDFVSSLQLSNFSFLKHSCLNFVFLLSLNVVVACQFVSPIFLLFPLCPASLPVFLLPHHQHCVHLFLLPTFGLLLRKPLQKSFLKYWRMSCPCTLPLHASTDAPACLPSLSLLYVLLYASWHTKISYH